MKCQIISVPTFTDTRGSLGVMEGAGPLPFQPKRFYYIYGVPEASARGQHAHKSEEELIFALSGSFKVRVDDGTSVMQFSLDHPDRALYVPAFVWHELYDFSKGAVCAVLASQNYNPDDYYQVYGEFLKAVEGR
jgi:dTDP-4-dehydrorhamnose 3,5-epimerase-like enzyme